MLDLRPPARPGVLVPLPELQAVLARYGLRVRGGFATDRETDGDILLQAPWMKTLILVGSAGSELWDKSAAEIAATPGPDPLDRWTRQVIDPIAQSIEGIALYPFVGPPYWPFQRWAERAEGVRASPIGIQIHPEYGLWHAYRAAILLPAVMQLAPPVAGVHPCDSCGDRPCLTHCPVHAFSARGYEVDRCVDHVVAMQYEAGACQDVGCLTRLACPVGVAWRYRPDHARFHMSAFVRARLGSRVAKS